MSFEESFYNIPYLLGYGYAFAREEMITIQHFGDLYVRRIFSWKIPNLCRCAKFIKLCFNNTDRKVQAVELGKVVF